MPWLCATEKRTLKAEHRSEAREKTKPNCKYLLRHFGKRIKKFKTINAKSLHLANGVDFKGLIRFRQKSTCGFCDSCFRLYQDHPLSDLIIVMYLSLSQTLR